MITFEISGIIKLKEKDLFDKIKILTPHGFKIDLVNWFADLKDSFPEKLFQVNYWIADVPCTKIEMKENTLRKLFGDVNAEYETHSYCYSSWTSGTDYNTILSIGGHDLTVELAGTDGRFILIEVNIQNG